MVKDERIKGQIQFYFRHNFVAGFLLVATNLIKLDPGVIKKFKRDRKRSKNIEKDQL